MNKVLNAIKCHHCKETLRIPVILPCGHSMCKIHADEAADQVKCPKCGVSHPKQAFAINTELQEMIDSQIASFDFGPYHKEAKEACDNLEDILDQIDAMIKDPVYFSHQAIDELKNQVHLKSEQLKVEIDEYTEKLLAALTEYQENCVLRFKESIFESGMKSLENNRIQTESTLKDWLDYLNKLRVDNDKWRSIKKACDIKIVDLNKELESFKKLILMREFKEKKDQVNHFVNVNLSLLFRMDIRIINSAILDDEQKSKLREMCRISPYIKWTLLWRGSRHGFGADHFHIRCDNIPNTFTIIKTAKGNIFGGYAQQIWQNSPSTTYGRDPNAYIYSLVNELNSSFVMKIKNPEYAIVRDKKFGPIFGFDAASFTYDIVICDNSNKVNNFSKVSCYCPSNGCKGKPVIFQVKEIEVFQLG